MSAAVKRTTLRDIVRATAWDTEFVYATAFDAYRTEVEALLRQAREALVALRDEQNGPPLVRRARQWQEAFDGTAAVLASIDKALGE